MLRASWQRDRQVRQRRTAWRWFLWGLWRYGVPVVAGTIAAVWVTAYTLDLFDSTHRASPAPSPASPQPRRVLPPAPSAPAGQDPSAPAGSGLTTAHIDTVSGLRLDTQMGQTATAAVSAGPAAAPDPDLKPDKWLHSKEP